MAPVNTGLLVAAAPLHAHVHGAAESTSGGFPLLASVGLYVLVVLVGSLVAPTLSRVDSPGRARRWLVGVLAFGYAGTVIGQVARHELSAVIACGIGTALAVALLALRR